MSDTELFRSQDQIQARVKQLAQQISSDVTERPILVAVLKGSVIFLADLIRELSVEADIDFMSISSYPGAGQRSGVVRIVKDMEMPVEDREVIVVEDVVDTGLTLAFLLRNLETRGPRTLRICTLINKGVRRIVEPFIHYSGFETSEFLVGYGLDFKGRYRNLPDLLTVKDLPRLVADPRRLEYLYSEEPAAQPGEK